mgnify:CR=1 FL=1
MSYIIVVLILIIIALSCLCLRKQYINRKELYEYQKAVTQAKTTYQMLDDGCREREQALQEAERKYYSIVEAYKKQAAKNQEDLDIFFTQQREQRLIQLEDEMTRQQHATQALLEEKLRVEQENYQQQTNDIIQAYDHLVADYDSKTKQLENKIQYQIERYNSLLAPLQQYEKDRMSKLFYTIQVPDEYKKDIDYLLNTVSQKVQHPDIINKLVWAEYVKPYIEDTFKRVGIKEEPGIYKITNIDSGKAYIGKSTNIKKRLIDHFKSSIGIKTISDQLVHHAILETGFWNWSIEYIIYCDKEQLSEMEKYYITFFKTQEFGYNRKEGG